MALEPCLPPPCLSTHGKFVIEPVSEEGIWQLSEIGLAQGGDAVNVLEVHVPPKVRLPLGLELLPEEGQSGQAWYRSDRAGGGRGICREKQDS